MEGSELTPTVEDLLTQNSALRARVDAAEQAIRLLRLESQQRTIEVRQLVQDVPATSSRWAVLRSLGRDVRHHPDKAGVVTAVARKVGRVPRRLWRSLRGT